MRIFISYSSIQRKLCERLQFTLEAGGRHQVFRDGSELIPGKPFDDRIREAIENCELFIFLVSPESVAPNSYALAELSIAQRRWRHPGGHVLPVMVAPTPKDAIPPYVLAVTIFEPRGDAVAETAAEIEARASNWWRSGRVRAMLAAAVVLAAALGAASFLYSQRQRAEDSQAGALATAAAQLCESGDHALAWQRYEDAIARHPGRPALRAARDDCGMRWLREIHVREGKQTFEDIVNRVLPVLSESAASASGQRAADLQAHMGWADFLRIREGAIGLDPPARYRKAVATDPSNVYAHALWGHHIMVTRGPVDDARRHFAAALASGRERAFVRDFQFAAMLYYHELAGQIEAARVATDMRKSGEALGPHERDRLWTYVYYSGLSTSDRPAFLAAMRHADDAATFRWLFPENEVRSDRKTQWRFFLASLEEAAGDRAAARSRFESLREDLQRERSSGRMLDETIAAIKRLTNPPS